VAKVMCDMNKMVKDQKHIDFEEVKSYTNGSSCLFTTFDDLVISKFTTDINQEDDDSPFTGIGGK